ncbi:MAG: hypothetical protein WA621_18890 [Candidatus Acidiferrum sp.]
MTRKNNQKPSEAPPVGISAPAVNLTASPVRIQPVTTLGFQPSFPGNPIMGENFITGTGILLPKT